MVKPDGEDRTKPKREPQVRVPPALRQVGGTLHDWMNTGIGTLAATLYLAHCAGIHPLRALGSVLGWWP